MENFKRSSLSDIYSEQIENAFTDSLYEMARTLSDSIIFQIIEDSMYLKLKDSNINNSDKTRQKLSDIKVKLYSEFNDHIRKSIDLGILKCFFPATDWNNYLEIHYEKKGK